MKTLALIGGFLYFIRVLIHWILQLYCYCFHDHPGHKHRFGLLGISIEIENAANPVKEDS